MSIDFLDPNLTTNPPVQTDARQVEPIKEDTVSIQKEKLENRKSQEETQQRGRRRRRRKHKDTVELSSQPETAENAEEQEEDEATQEVPGKTSEHKIDIVI